MLPSQDAYDGTLVAELETLAEMVRSQGATEVMKEQASRTSASFPLTKLDRRNLSAQMTPDALIRATAHYLVGMEIEEYTRTELEEHLAKLRRPHCPSCQEGLVRIIRSDDTVRHVNGEKCKRFHS
jgi:hypothetical protein